jgi:hypothetical protein
MPLLIRPRVKKGRPDQIIVALWQNRTDDMIEPDQLIVHYKILRLEGASTDARLSRGYRYMGLE